MKSPFPGMDPFLEQFWLDIHASLIIYTRDQLEEQLPASLIARVEERAVFETEEPRLQARYPDVKITERPGRKNGGVGVLAVASPAEPVIVEYLDEPATETFINIIEAGPGQRLVTVIEILSLANKLPGERQQQYRQKQKELRDAGVSLVEIDLLRSGERVLSVPRWLVPPDARTTYQACVRRGWLPHRFEIYPIPLRRSLPVFAIPLRVQDKDIHLDLQAVLEQAYRKGRYHLTIDFKQRPDPPLTAADAKWAKSQLKSPRKGK
jgi:hypothetical protein